MLQKICLIYCYINTKEARNSTMLPTSISNNIQATKEINKVEESRCKAKKQILQQVINIHTDLNHIQQRSMQVCNCDTIGSDYN